MTDSNFMKLIDLTLDSISNQINDLLDVDIDVDVDLRGHVLNINFYNFCHIVITIQTHIQELWLAASNKGGFHYYYDGFKWKDKRSSVDFEDRLSEICSAASGTKIIIKL